MNLKNHTFINISKNPDEENYICLNDIANFKKVVNTYVYEGDIVNIVILDDDSTYEVTDEVYEYIKKTLADPYAK